MESLHYLLMKAHSMMKRSVISQALAIGLTPGQPKILEYLSAHEGSDQKTIAAYCEIKQATVGSILGRMEAAELIIRKQAEGNRRSLHVYLTDKGRKAVGDVASIFAESEGQAIQNLTSGEVEQLKVLLEKICQALSLEKEEDPYFE